MAVGGFMADEWVFVSADGITPKADIIGWIASGRLVHHTMAVVEPERIVVHGDAAVLTARKASTGSWDGVLYSADEWLSEVYLRQAGGNWLCVLSHKCDAVGT